MRFDWDLLREIKAEGFLAIVPHPDPAAGLWLLNYTARAQYQAAWDRYPALLDWRGTVVAAFLALNGKEYDDTLRKLREPSGAEPVRPLEE